MIARILREWGNRDYAPGPAFLEAVQRYATGHVIDVGSGATTLLLRELGVPHTTLEHDPDWAARAEVGMWPFEDGWYVIPPSMLDFWHEVNPRLVVCDGPPEQSGDRWKLSFIFAVLPADCVILLHDADRADGCECIRRWTGWKVEGEFPDGETTFAVLRRA